MSEGEREREGEGNSVSEGEREREREKPFLITITGHWAICAQTVIDSEPPAPSIKTFR